MTVQALLKGISLPLWLAAQEPILSGQWSLLFCCSTKQWSWDAVHTSHSSVAATGKYILGFEDKVHVVAVLLKSKIGKRKSTECTQ